MDTIEHIQLLIAELWTNWDFVAPVLVPIAYFLN
jgi:hypothetical protein